MPRVIEVIESTLLKGDGKNTPIRNVIQIHTLEGILIAEHDETADNDVMHLVKILMDGAENKELLKNVSRLINE